MKKYIIVLICLIFLSGCSATYEIKIKENKIEEKLTLIEKNQNLFDIQNESGWTLRQIFDSLLSTNLDEFSLNEYSAKSLTNDNQLGVEFYSNSSNRIINSSVINQCYMKPVITEEENIVTINTGSDFKCYEYYENLESIKVVLTTDYKVVSSNADSVENGKYIWDISIDDNKQIEFSYDRSSVKNNNILIIVICAIGLMFVGCISYYIYSRIKSQNKI